MAKLAYFSASLILLSHVATGQVVTRELRELNARQAAILRQHLGISDAVSISVGNPKVLAATDSTIKVFLAVGPDPRIRNDFVRRISQWNERRGRKYRLLEIVDRMQDADLLLAQTSTQLEPRELPQPTMEERAGVPGAPRYPIGLPPQSLPPDFDIHRTGYVIAQSPNKLEVLARVRYMDHSGPHPRSETSRILCEDFFKLVEKYSK